MTTKSTTTIYKAVKAETLVTSAPENTSEIDCNARTLNGM